VINLQIFTLRHCAMNRGFGGWFLSLVVICLRVCHVRAHAR